MQFEIKTTTTTIIVLVVFRLLDLTFAGGNLRPPEVTSMICMASGKSETREI